MEQQNEMAGRSVSPKLGDLKLHEPSRRLFQVGVGLCIAGAGMLVMVRALGPDVGQPMAGVSTMASPLAIAAGALILVGLGAVKAKRAIEHFLIGRALDRAGRDAVQLDGLDPGHVDAVVKGLKKLNAERS